MTAKRKPQEQPEGPAIITPVHVQDRVISPGAGAPRAWRKLSAHQQEYAKGKLKGGSPRNDAARRYDAGQHFDDVFAYSQSEGRDSTRALLAGHGGGSLRGPSLSPAFGRQADAIATLKDLQQHMSRNDFAIIELVCGHGHQPAEAVRQVCRDYEDTVSARYREALDGLIDGMDRLRRQPRR